MFLSKKINNSPKKYLILVFFINFGALKPKNIGLDRNSLNLI